MKKRKDSFFGLHFDFHAKPEYGMQGKTLKEEDVREICRAFHPDFIQIDCKGHPGWASYPSELGNAMPEFEKDTLALWRRITREEGVALYMHYSGIYDMKYCSEHPEQNVMTASGTSIPGATRLDSSYVDDLLIPQLSELYEKYGIDGVWVDGECWKASADFHPETLRNFEKATGINLDGKLPATSADPYFREYREYHRDLFRKYLRHYVDKLHEKYPDFQIASNWAFSDHMPERVTANVDFLSGDLNPAGSVNSARYAARALAGQGLPWDLMSWNFRLQSGDRSACVSKHPAQLMQEAAAVISLGGAFQNYIMQYKDGSPNMTEIKNQAALAEFMRAREDYCFRGTPIHQAALLLSTYDRNIESRGLYSRNGYEKIMGLTALLCDVGQSLEIVGEHTLEEQIDEFKMIAVPELFSGIAKETIKILLDYAERGGNLLLVGRNTCRLFAENGATYKTAAMDEFLSKNAAVYDNGHASNMKAAHKPYYFTTDEANFGALFSPISVYMPGIEPIATIREDLRAEPYSVAVKVAFGEGTITAIGFDAGSQYLEGAQYMHRTLIKAAADSLYTPMVKVESAVGLIEIVALLKNEKKMIQLVNGGGNHADVHSATTDFIPPVWDIKLSIALDKEPKALTLQPEGKKLDFEYKNGRAYLTVDRVDIHSVIEVDE